MTVRSGQQLLRHKKTVNTGGKRGGNPVHTICPPCFAIFLRVFGDKISKSPKFALDIGWGWFGETENAEPKKTGKDYKNRGFRTVLRSEWVKRANLKLEKNKKRKFVQKKPPRKRHRIVALSARWVFRVFGAFPKKGPKMRENTIKIVVSCFFSVTVSKGVFGRNGWGGNLVPGPGGSGRGKPLGLRKSNFQFFP